MEACSRVCLSLLSFYGYAVGRSVHLFLSPEASRVKTTRGRRLSRSLNSAVLDVYLKKFKVTPAVHGLAPRIVPHTNPEVEPHEREKRIEHEKRGPLVSCRF